MRRAFGIATRVGRGSHVEKPKEREGWDGLERMSVALLRSNRCSRLSYEGRLRRADFAPRSRDPACAGELALLRPAPAGLRRVAP